LAGNCQVDDEEHQGEELKAESLKLKASACHRTYPAIKIIWRVGKALKCVRADSIQLTAYSWGVLLESF
jgi:hypothetical protein